MAKWLSDAVFYEIYPQSFLDTDADGIGNLEGIIRKLDYVKELGCNALWLNPFYVSPFLDAGYDVEDYYSVAPRYGTNEDAKRLFEEVHKRDMHVIIDLVPGHTSYKHPWFLESMKAEKNEYTDRYVWTDSVWEAPQDMQWLRGISDRDGSAALNFFSGQPALNYGFFRCDRPWMQPMDAPGPRATAEELKNIMRFWLKLGCDGFRVDMAGSLIKNDDENATGIIRLWNGFREFLDAEFPEAAMISEWGAPDKSLAAGFHMDFLLHFGESHYNDLFRCDEPYFSFRGKGEIGEFIKTYRGYCEKTGGKGLICIPSGNHDMGRLRERLGEEEIKLAFAFLLSMPGAPFVYYGDEIGMRQLSVRSVEGGYGRTGARSPMQWNGGVNAGFSAAPKDRLYIPVDESVDRPTVERQQADPNSLYHTVRHLLALRHEHRALQSEAELVFETKSGYPLIYRRKSGDEEILVVINPSPGEYEVSKGCGGYEVLMRLGEGVKLSERGVSVLPRSAAWLKCK